MKARSPGQFTGLVREGTKHHIRCSNEAAHTIPGPDGATYIVNASEAGNKGFVYNCQHGHCKGLDRLVFLRKLLEAGALVIGDLTDKAFLAPPMSASDAEVDPPPKITATPFAWRDPATIPIREWLYGYHLIRKFVGLTIAPGATGKSSLLIADALAMTSGRPILGTTTYGKPLQVWIWNLEDPSDELERRVAATMQYYGITPADIGDRLFMDSGRDQSLCIARQDRNCSTIMEPIIDALVAELLARQIDVLIIDPFVSSHTVSENDNGAMDAVVKAWGRVAERANCAIELVHHLRKLNGAEATAESSRGAIALVAAARSVRVLNAMTKDEAEKANLESRRGYFRVGDDKNNLAPQDDATTWFQIVSVLLANGDNIGVVAPWRWPSPFAGVTVADLLAVQRAVHGKSCRADVQSPDWVGHTVADVIGLDTADKTDQTKIKSLLKTWIKNGALVVVERPDSKRIQRKFIEVGNWATTGCHTFEGEVGQREASGATGACHTAPPAPPPYRGGQGGGGAPGDFEVKEGDAPWDGPEPANDFQFESLDLTDVAIGGA